MSLLLITNPPTALLNDSEWTDLVLRSNANMLGHGLSIPIFTLTNWDATTTIPQIAQGSIIEVGGSFYQADVDTALTPEGGIIDGTVHIKLVPAGGGASVVPTLTNDAIPAWDAVIAGWYTSDDKFLPFEMTKATAVYTVKSEFIDQNKTIKISTVGNIVLDGAVSTDSVIEKTALAGVSIQAQSGEQLLTKIIEIGDWDMVGTVTVNIPHGLSKDKIRDISVIIRNDDNSVAYDFLSKLNLIVDTPSGQIGQITSTNIALTRVSSGYFDSVSFNLTPFNRGWVKILYEA